MTAPKEDLFLLWLKHRDLTVQENHEAELFFAGGDRDKGGLIGWRCTTCGTTAGEVPQ